MEFLECKWTIIKRRRQTETIFHQILFSRTVTTIHRPNLRNAHVTLIDHEEKVLWEEIEQTIRAFACISAIKVPRIVFNARTMSQLLDHLHVIFYTFLDALRLDAIADALEKVHLLDKVVLYHADGLLGLFLGCHEKIGWINLVGIKGFQTMIGEGIDLLDTVYLVVPPSHSQHIVTVCHVDIDSFALHTEIATLKFDVISHVEGIHQLP